ncbi:hypothetical protein VPA32_orf066 [Klebsiella phage vB_KpnM_VPA32]|jgi:hypothetical protein|uniref:Phage protein n=2 Tax=Karamvirus TaxID=1913650 RepID=A0A1D3RKI3_9CAUD|nr:hypothetical protein CC31p063 [Enterobacter phage CC31]YP_010091673.1 hypothetical protein KNT70_gp058 [Cronobacter phage Pet-CM3-4]UES35653.1 hypothetical protein KKP3262_000035 [Enterobacter phage KKP_3262]ULA52298.1 hypothetical protein [Enterobacter phage vB-EclM_KMB19]UVD32444.1 hypothetical protein ENTB43_009 [Enterobacter phage Entb_43]WJJ59031.1 hypothetical protein VPA32_orf066 [Klebsiella phage vB_KpnM_VPA32]ADB81559.1 conserved hypothetical protein [Enterobacter phage CC31]
MSQAIKNVLNAFVFPKVEAMKVDGEFKDVIVTPKLLDKWEVELHGTMKENDQKIGKARIRELVVAYILSEFNLDAFGIPTIKRKEISDSTIRKMKNQRKKGFVDLKIVKAAK